ncbi:poly(ADP-ribose) polymerase 2 [Actinidia rufa]|uniref:Poly(ADP-ribose) polymerase 2 n=1 Tax=Actinidia rufa TaxID=165716 RepID=A0A7J0GRY0_9ERIC|nr:poly(ADP-ribose) polymerase 2 [Actinidia rufa]
MWNHADCTLKKGNQIKAYVLPFYDHNLDWQRSLDDVEGIELLRWDDQEKIRKYVESGGPQNTPSAAVMEYGMEVSQTSRATCRRCNQKIMKGEVRISTKPDGRGGKGLAWHHANCFQLLKWRKCEDGITFQLLIRLPSLHWLRSIPLPEKCADGMLFGALGWCSLCSGCLRYSGGMYRCHGYLSAWNKCSYSTTEPERVKQKWKIPEETTNDYLFKWFKSQKAKKSSRTLPQPSNIPSGNQAANEQHQSSNSEKLEGDMQDEWKSQIEGAGGQFHTKIKKVVSGVLDDKNAEMKAARRMKKPIVREDYLVNCFKRQKKLSYDLYKIEAIGEASSIVTVKVKRAKCSA